MASSWLEPAILLASSGVAVLINMGTNAIFGEISYITAAVAAILQLALSVDYSIVLLHNFRALKLECNDKHEAMLKAVKATFKPVLASAGTTIAGLLALLFMTMKIGRDIGIVLTKGIVISMLTSLTLLPALLLVCDKLMQKFSKHDLVLSGKKLCSIAFKRGKMILAIALVVIILCGVLNVQNTYIFTDSANPNQTIIDTFGSNNTIVVVYPNEREDWEKEKELADKLAAYKNADGTTPFQNYTAYSNTVREIYTIEMAAKKLKSLLKSP
jgi:predicted RND superfamily exporter protein